VPNIAKPATSAVKFVKSTCRIAIIRMSTIGSGTRSSASAHVTKKISATAASTSVGVDVQPQLSPSVSATSIAISPPESSVAPTKSTREGVLIGDSGTNRCTSTAAAAMLIAPTMNSQRQERWSTIRPDNTIPKPPPIPNTAEMRPIATPTFSRGNSSG
jgi:hypothetical protein